MRRQLTAPAIEKLASPATGRVEIFDAIMPGLVLRVSANGQKTFAVRGRVKGQPQPIRFTIGDARVMKLAEARQAASDVLRAMRAGDDPRDAKKAKAARGLTFDKLIEEWKTLHLAQRRPRYAEEATRAIRKGLPDLLSRPAAAITKPDVVNALDQIMLARKPGAAGHVLAYGRACFGWAEKRGKVPSNPFDRLPMSSATGERERVLSDSEIDDIWSAAGTLSYPFGPFFRISLLTLQRRDEVAGMRWSELAADFGRWTIPGVRMKNGKPHDVHLSGPACAILRELPRFEGCDLVFTSRRRRSAVNDGPAPISGFSQARRYLDAAITTAREARDEGPIPEWWLHDFRRTGVTKLAELGFDSVVADKLLAHQPAKLRGVAGVYQRHEFLPERVKALDAWAAYVTGDNRKGTNVLPIRRASRNASKLRTRSVRH